MKKYADYYLTTKKFPEGYKWFIRDKDGAELESSSDNLDEMNEEYFETKEMAEQAGIESIQEYY